jgi:hypothetical protein
VDASQVCKSINPKGKNKMKTSATLQLYLNQFKDQKLFSQCIILGTALVKHQSIKLNKY